MASTRAPVTQDAWRPWALRVLLALGLLALLPALPVWTPLQRLEHDLLASWTASPPPDVGVLVVGLDEPSLAALNLTPPLPRRLHAQLVQALREGRVQVQASPWRDLAVPGLPTGRVQ